LTLHKKYIKINHNSHQNLKKRSVSMATAANRSDVRVPMTPWWLVLIEGILAIIVGILLWIYPVRAFLWVTYFIGFYWIISGIFDIVSIFFNRAAWGWKLFMGIIGIFAGGYLVTHVVAGAVSLAIVTIWIVGLAGIFYGILGLIRAFQGAGWGAGILGIVSIIFGIFILTNRLAAALTIPWMFGFMGIFGGLLAIFGAFTLRSAQKAAKAAAVKTTAPVQAVSPAPVAAAAASAAVAEVTPSAEAAAPDATRFEGVSLEAAPVAEAAVVGGAAAVLAAAVDEPAEVVSDSEAVVEETRVAVGEEVSAIAEAPAEVVAQTSTVVEETGAVVAEAGVDVLGAAGAAAVAGSLVAEKAGTGAEETAAIVEETGAVVEEATQVIEAVPEVAEKASLDVEEVKAVEIPDVVDIPAEQANFLKKEIEYVEGIGPVYGAKLKAVGINSPLDLLRKGATRKGRELIAEASGITITLILKWVNHADLFRLKGVGSEYADLLEAAGVDTVVELAQRNATNLHNKMVATNEEKKLVRQLPSVTQVENWVSEAKLLDRVITY
jgi:uncharacterized membrane protein HdeD (DUF308 family)